MLPIQRAFAAAVSEAVGESLEGVERGSQKTFIFLISVSEQRGCFLGVIIHKLGTLAQQSWKAEGQDETPSVPLCSSSLGIVSERGLWR